MFNFLNSVRFRFSLDNTIPHGGWWRKALVSPDGVAPSRMVGVSAFVNFPLHHKVQKFSSVIGSPGWSRKKGRKTVVVVVVDNTSIHTRCGDYQFLRTASKLLRIFQDNAKIQNSFEIWIQELSNS